MGVRVDVHNLSKSYGALDVLRGVTLTIAEGDILCLLGPSGCGKTTLLRTITGLETAEQGEILVDGAPITHIPVHQRDFGLMFQDFALFPHMTVTQNVAFGLRMHRVPQPEQARRVQEVLELVGLGGFAGRSVTQLSGGERQRVALARSLAPNPRLLMLDEPLGSLDAGLRERLVVELREIIKRVGLTAVYVTHDQQEAFAIADQIAVMDAGRIEQMAPPEDLYRAPQTVFVARFLQLTNVVPVRTYQNGTAYTDIGAWTVPEAQAILIHPDDLRLDEDGTLHGVVQECVFRGEGYQIKVVVNDLLFTLKIPRQMRVDVGQPVRLAFSPEAVVPLRA
ncbi:MAG: ABC transporter ATP-binding protein [Anaerolineae bacterium]